MSSDGLWCLWKRSARSAMSWTVQKVLTPPSHGAPPSDQLAERFIDLLAEFTQTCGGRVQCNFLDPDGLSQWKPGFTHTHTLLCSAHMMRSQYETHVTCRKLEQWEPNVTLEQTLGLQNNVCSLPVHASPSCSAGHTCEETIYFLKHTNIQPPGGKRMMSCPPLAWRFPSLFVCSMKTHIHTKCEVSDKSNFGYMSQFFSLCKI